MTIKPLILGIAVGALALIGMAAVTTGPNNTGTNVINVSGGGGGGGAAQSPITGTVDYAGFPAINMNYLLVTNVLLPPEGHLSFNGDFAIASIEGETNVFGYSDIVFKTGDPQEDRMVITGGPGQKSVIITNSTLEISDGSQLLLNGLVSIRPASSPMLIAPATGVTLLSFKTNTTDNTTNTIGTIDLSGSHAISIVATFIGVDGSDNVATYMRRAQFANGGGINQKGTTATLGLDYEDVGAAAWGVIIEGDGGESALIEVYGGAAQNVSWTVSVSVTTAD